jgi:hypothetical protein
MNDDSGGSIPLVSIPDLIIVFDAETGRSLKVQEYKDNLQVVVICNAASPCRTDAARGFKLGGPSSMRFDNVVYKPVGIFTQPRSVIGEFGNLTDLDIAPVPEIWKYIEVKNDMQIESKESRFCVSVSPIILTPWTNYHVI